ncbi:MAG: threonine synthase [Armatimonadota bacterium]|nr:threonine synthase [Armatimonadota bacterium]
MAFSFLSHLECTHCGTILDADALHGTCPQCGKVLFPRYDLVAAGRSLTKDALRARPPDMWRYHEVLPIRDPRHVLTLGEGMTPILEARRLASRYGLRQILMKDEGKNPTGTFKARGLCVATSRARELGVGAVSMPTAGNAGAALAAYAARGGLDAYIVMPEDTPPINKAECAIYGARAYSIRGLIDDAGRVLRQVARARGWFDLSTLREPYRVEGKKTMGYEIAEQLRWDLPDAIVYPTGGGTGIVGIWKAFEEMDALGWIGPRRPRMFAVQAAGCAPIVRAFRSGQPYAEPFENAHTIAAGLRVPAAIGDYLILRAIRKSEGGALAVTDADLQAGMAELARLEGVFAAPEAAATVAALDPLLESRALRPDDRVLLLLTGAGMKYADLVQPQLQAIDPEQPIAIGQASDPTARPSG